MQKKKQIILVNRCGRLANRLVFFANFAALAEELNCSVVNCTFHSYAAFFENTRKDIYCRYPASSQQSLWDMVPGVSNTIRETRLFYHMIRTASNIQEKWSLGGSSIVTLHEPCNPDQSVTSLEKREVLDRISDGDIIFIKGWKFRAPKWVKKHAESIRDYFQPIEQFDQSARLAIDDLRKNGDIAIAIHIRRGDYRKWNSGRYYFSIEQYRRWMHELVEQFQGSRVAFLVCSDEQRSPDEFPGLTVRLGPGTPMGDMHAMAQCDWICGPLSTFTQWSSFYGAKPLFHLRNSNDHLELPNFEISYLDEVPGHPLPE